MRHKHPAMSAVGLCLFLVGQIAAAKPPSDVCALPSDLQSEITNKYPGRTLVNVSDLTDDDREFFQKEHGNSCPGLVKLDFYGDGKPTFALALTTNALAKGRTELVVAHQVASMWKTTTLETVSGDAAVAWSEKPGEYKDVYGEKKIHATAPVIVFCRYEASKILYAWTHDRVTKIRLSD
jgi:hypothetical protein